MNCCALFPLHLFVSCRCFHCRNYFLFCLFVYLFVSIPSFISPSFIYIIVVHLPMYVCLCVCEFSIYFSINTLSLSLSLSN